MIEVLAVESGISSIGQILFRKGGIRLGNTTFPVNQFRLDTR